MLNEIILMGRLVRDPKLRTTQSGMTAASFAVACERDYSPQGQDRQTDFIDIVCFGKTADFVGQYFAKGMLVAIKGRLQLRDWTDKQGNKRRSAEVLADRCYFAEGRRQDTAQPGAAFERLPDTEPVPFAGSDPKQMELDTPDDALPF